MRTRILLILIFGMVGVEAELLLIGHTEDRVQWIPVVALGVGTGVVLLRLLKPGKATVRALAVVMALFVVAGFVGLYQHYAGNKEFELEMYPSMQGLELFKEALTGATPALAPGTMILLGLIGLATCIGDPRTQEMKE